MNPTDFFTQTGNFTNSLTTYKPNGINQDLEVFMKLFSVCTLVKTELKTQDDGKLFIIWEFNSDTGNFHVKSYNFFFNNDYSPSFVFQTTSGKECTEIQDVYEFLLVSLPSDDAAFIYFSKIFKEGPNQITYELFETLFFNFLYTCFWKSLLPAFQETLPLVKDSVTMKRKVLNYFEFSFALQFEKEPVCYKMLFWDSFSSVFDCMDVPDAYGNFSALEFVILNFYSQMEQKNLVPPSSLNHLFRKITNHLLERTVIDELKQTKRFRMDQLFNSKHYPF